MNPRRPALTLLLFLLALAACSAGPRPENLSAVQGEPPRILFFALDSIPFGIVEELTHPSRGEERLFADFAGPVPLISSFPSTSSVAFTGILEPYELPPPPGYEARFFDHEKNKVRGGGYFSYLKIPFSWREFFTWRYDTPIPRGIASARPVHSAEGEVLWVLDRFARSEERQFHGYVALTDTTAHLKGPEGLVPVLETLDEGIRRLRRDNPDHPFYAVIYSDHGIAGDATPLTNLRDQVKKTLEGNGYRLRNKIEGEGDAVIIPFGLVSSFEVHTSEGRGPEVARLLGAIEGIDLCVTPQPEGAAWLVASPWGEAEVARRGGPGGEEWTYRPDHSDPLGYAAVVEELRRRAGDPERVWFPDSWWFEASFDHHFPDALHRLARGFDLVDNAASVICSLAPGHMFGAATTAALARISSGRLKWTHGALHREASLGFFLTDIPGWEPPPAVRFDEALIPFREAPRELPGAALTSDPGPGE